MAREHVEKAQSEEPEKSGTRRTRSPARALGLLVVLGFVLAFIIQNGQKVSVHLWFVTENVRLIWLAIVCLIVGAGGEMAIRRAVRLRWRARRLRNH